MTTKQDFATWFKSVPGVSGWFGNAKIDLWAKGAIWSVTYDKYFAWYQAGQIDSVLADIQRHTGSLQTAIKNKNVYGPIITFLTNQLANQKTALDAIKGTVDDTPITEDVISTTIQNTQAALTYYTNLQAQIH